MSAFLFDFINKQMEVSHPLCEECTDSILDAMDQQLKVSRKIAFNGKATNINGELLSAFEDHAKSIRGIEI